MHLTCHSRLGDGGGRIASFHENPIIVSKKSQRNPSNIAPFGIKNAGRTAGKNKFVIGGRINQPIPARVTVRLGDLDLLFGNDFVEATHSRCSLSPSFEKR